MNNIFLVIENEDFEKSKLQLKNLTTGIAVGLVIFIILVIVIFQLVRYQQTNKRSTNRLKTNLPEKFRIRRNKKRTNSNKNYLVLTRSIFFICCKFASLQQHSKIDAPRLYHDKYL